jgi:diacylglycerol O-acyltransferase / wax synthase
MTERLSSADVAFFYLEGRTTPQHVGAVAVFQPPESGFDYDQLVGLLEQRIALVPRYRQRVRSVPGHLANPVWVDDPNFDITYHVRRSALPRPGTQAQLLDFCARIQSRLLDRARPLWEMYLVEGLAGGNIALVTKTHHSMVDGLGAVDIAQVILDSSPEADPVDDTLWMPEPEPSATELVLDALGGVIRRPTAVVDAVRLGARDVRASTAAVTTALGGALPTALAFVRPTPSSPLRVRTGQQRRIAVARTRLQDYRRVRQVHGGTVNDVVLATVAGALRAWLLQRGEQLTPAASVRALVPVSVSADDDSVGRNQVSPLLVDLPVGESSPVQRLARLSLVMAEHKRSGHSVGADALIAVSGFAPPTLHALGARAVNGLARRLFSLVVTNVPGPQLPVYATGARLTEIFPVVPLGPGQAVSIGLTSYDGGVYYGVNGDWDAMPDVDALAGLLEESLAELVAASPAAETRGGTGERARSARRGPATRRAVAHLPREARP